ncbi:tRNA lysidine(34) synthetase TilS [Terracoccus luteus]|uniref:tRNA(Ile)-lysidine synthase n=1 Tax=Terracoccus luteus TaxID=53356 RepID=A0A839PPW1_9MICO|nr:tRNA lysidine(34) synthetase TilS [Terracoccus luteus]MBB2986240.1 tRNA(Ile)-lysidine synthase [Terracoccus luteus]MCP2172170.1 tRNA(Ile)-lysidine synthase [Terracoccus luteus]
MRGPSEVPGPDPAVAATRLAVRDHLGDLEPGSLVLSACSGGPDSTALAAALAFEASRAGMRAGAVVVDHRLQEGSGAVAQEAASLCRDMGLDPVEVVEATVPTTGAGLEADARSARFAAITATADRLGAALVMLGHTRDDQAEQVLLGLSRGSGARSLSGMPVRRDRFVRPLLSLPRATTLAACAAYGIDPWDDPHNRDESFRRVRARRLLASLEAELGPGFAAALARSADLLREDADHLETLAVEARASLPDADGHPGVDLDALAALPRAIRTRVWRLLAAEAGAPLADVSAAHVESLDALLTSWHGQGPLHVPGGIAVARERRAIRFRPLRDAATA